MPRCTTSMLPALPLALIASAPSAALAQTTCGEFTATPYPVGAAVGAGPQELIVLDLNGDGSDDLVSVNTAENTLSLLLNDGAGDFSSATHTSVPDALQPALAAGDFDGDGDLDLAVGAVDVAQNALVQVLTSDLANGGAGDYTLGPAIDFSAIASLPAGVALGDLDGSGTADLAVALSGPQLPPGTGGIAIRLDGIGGPLALAAPSGGFQRPADVALDDLDGDGDLDVVATMRGTGTPTSLDAVLLYENDGSGTFAAPLEIDAGFNPGRIACGDLDGDGDRDVAITVESNTLLGTPGGLRLLLTDLTAGAWSGAGVSVLGVFDSLGQAPIDLALGDLSDDGLPGFLQREDLFVANFGSSDVSRMNGYSGLLQDFDTVELCTAGTTPLAVAIGHFNSDFTLDVAVADSSSDAIQVLLSVPQALAQTFGAGCQGLSAPAPGISAVGAPSLGSATFSVALADGRPFAPVLLALSLGQETFPLAGTGACALYLEQPLFRVQTLTDGSGAANVPLPVPGPGLGLDGLNVFFQFFVFDADGGIAPGLSASDALRIKLGA